MVDNVAKVLCLAAVFPAGAVVGCVCALVDGHGVKDVHEELMRRCWTGKCSKEPGQMRVVNLQSYRSRAENRWECVWVATTMRREVGFFLRRCEKEQGTKNLRMGSGVGNKEAQHRERSKFCTEKVRM